MKPTKPLGHRAYGSIGHLPGSRQSSGDKGLHPGQVRICTEKCRKGDTIIVQEKLDGTNVAVAKIDGRIVPLIRSGYEAISSHHLQHRMFAEWAFDRREAFDSILEDGERLCGEWLAQAHGTQYEVDDVTVFAAFDIMRGHDRLRWSEFCLRVGPKLDWFSTAPTFHAGGPLTVSEALELLAGETRYADCESQEGVVWRVENDRGVDFLGKYVRPTHPVGQYLPGVDGAVVDEPVWNWNP